LANNAVANFMVNVYWLGIFSKHYIEQAVGSEWDVTNLIDGAGRWSSIQLVTSAQLREVCDDRRFSGPCGEEKSGDRSFGDHVNQKKGDNHVDIRRGDEKVLIWLKRKVQWLFRNGDRWVCVLGGKRRNQVLLSVNICCKIALSFVDHQKNTPSKKLWLTCCSCCLDK
jgi:hypothetical protein